MLGRIKEVFSYFAEAFAMFFNKFVLSVLAGIIHFAPDASVSLINGAGISFIIGGADEFLEKQPNIFETFSYAPISTVFLGIAIAIVWLAILSVFEIFTYHAFTSKGKSINLRGFIALIQSKLPSLIKTNMLKMVYVIMAFVPMIALSFLAGTLDQGHDLYKAAHIGILISFIPIIIVILKYYASTYFVLKKNSRPHEALRNSRDIIYNYKFPLCVLILTLFLFLLIIFFTAAAFSTSFLKSVLSPISTAAISVIGYYAMYIFASKRDRKD